MYPNKKKDSPFYPHEEYEKNITEFPTVCETCLGPNPYVRMQKFPSGGTCHISRRPYTVFRWKAGSDARYKKTLKCCVCIGQRKLLSTLTEDSRKSPNHEMVEKELNHLKMRYPIWASRYPQEELSRGSNPPKTNHRTYRDHAAKG